MSSLKKSFVLRFISVGLKQAVILLTSIFAANLLSIPNYADLSYLLAIYSIAYILADFGISTAATRYVANNPTESNAAKIMGLGIVTASLTFLLGSFVIGILVFFNLLSIKDPQFFIILLLMVAFSVAATIFEGVLRGLQRYVESTIVTAVASIIVLFLTYFLLTAFGVLGGLLAQLLYWVILSVGLFFLGKIMPNFSISWKEMSPLIKFSVQFGIASISYFLFSRYVLIVLGNVGATSELAAYELLSKVMLLFAFPFSIFGQILAPKYANESVASNKLLLRKDLTKYSVLLLPIATISVLLFWGVIQLVPYVLPQYTTLLASGAVVITMLAQLAIYIWTNLVDTGIIVPAGYAHIMTYTYVPLGIISFFALPYAFVLGGVPAVLSAVIVLQLIMAIVVRVLAFYSVR